VTGARRHAAIGAGCLASAAAEIAAGLVRVTFATPLCYTAAVLLVAVGVLSAGRAWKTRGGRR